MSPRDAIDARRARPLSDAARSADGTGRMSSPSSVSPRSGPISLTTDVRRTDTSSSSVVNEVSRGRRASSLAAGAPVSGTDGGGDPKVVIPAGARRPVERLGVGGGGEVRRRRTRRRDWRRLERRFATRRRRRLGAFGRAAPAGQVGAAERVHRAERERRRPPKVFEVHLELVVALLPPARRLRRRRASVAAAACAAASSRAAGRLASVAQNGVREPSGVQLRYMCAAAT